MLLTTSAIVIGLLTGTAYADTIRFWTTEYQPPTELQSNKQMADDFSKATGHSVEVIPIGRERLLGSDDSSVAAGDMPDVIYHPLSFVLPWAEAGIIDVETNSEIVDELGVDTFAPGAISMAQFDE